MNDTSYDNNKTIVAMALATVASFAPLPGCASLDPTDDIARSASLASSQTAVSADWTHPWDQPHTAWDGNAPLTADAAVQVALHNNRALRQQIEKITLARADFSQAHLPPNPVITLAAGSTVDGPAGSPLTIALAQQLAWLWQRDHAIDATDAGLAATILSTSDAAIQLASRVRSAHAQVVFLSQAVRILAQDAEIAEQIERALRSLYEAGEASMLEMNRAALETETSRAALTDATGAHERSMRTMLELLGMAEHHTHWTAVLDRPLTDELPAEQQLIELAAAQRLDVQAAASREHAMAARVGLAKRRQLPDVAAGVSYQRNFGDQPAAIGSLNITPKLFDDGSPAVARSNAEYRQAVIETNRVLQQAISQTRDAWVAWTTARDNVTRFSEQIITLAQQNSAAAYDAFEAGAIDVTSILDIRRRENAAHLRLNELTLELHRAHFALERAVGGTLRSEHTLSEADTVALANRPNITADEMGHGQ